MSFFCRGILTLGLLVPALTRRPRACFFLPWRNGIYYLLILKGSVVGEEPGPGRGRKRDVAGGIDSSALQGGKGFGCECGIA